MDDPQEKKTSASSPSKIPALTQEQLQKLFRKFTRLQGKNEHLSQRLEQALQQNQRLEEQLQEQSAASTRDKAEMERLKYSVQTLKTRYGKLQAVLRQQPPRSPASPSSITSVLLGTSQQAEKKLQNQIEVLQNDLIAKIAQSEKAQKTLFYERNVYAEKEAAMQKEQGDLRKEQAKLRAKQAAAEKELARARDKMRSTEEKYEHLEEDLSRKIANAARKEESLRLQLEVQASAAREMEMEQKQSMSSLRHQLQEMRDVLAEKVLFSDDHLSLVNFYNLPPFNRSLNGLRIRVAKRLQTSSQQISSLCLSLLSEPAPSEGQHAEARVQLRQSVLSDLKQACARLCGHLEHLVTTIEAFHHELDSDFHSSLTSPKLVSSVAALFRALMGLVGFLVTTLKDFEFSMISSCHMTAKLQTQTSQLLNTYQTLTSYFARAAESLDGMLPYLPRHALTASSLQKAWLNSSAGEDACKSQSRLGHASVITFVGKIRECFRQLNEGYVLEEANSKRDSESSSHSTPPCLGMSRDSVKQKLPGAGSAGPTRKQPGKEPISFSRLAQFDDHSEGLAARARVRQLEEQVNRLIQKQVTKLVSEPMQSSEHQPESPMKSGEHREKPKTKTDRSETIFTSPESLLWEPYEEKVMELLQQNALADERAINYHLQLTRVQVVLDDLTNRYNAKEKESMELSLEVQRLRRSLRKWMHEDNSNLNSHT
eukprot:g23962.t1